MNPPCRKPTDQAKYREQYLSNLALEASNNQKNLNANLIFKQTGQTPNQPTDFRTTTEKEADIDGMRKEVRSFVASMGFCNSSNANEVAQMLHPNELSFVLQYKLFISTDFKGRSVPTEVFIDYLRKLKQKTDQTLGVEFGLQQTTGEAILINARNILSALPDQATFERLQMGLTNIRQSNNQAIRNLTEVIETEMLGLREIIPTAEDFANIQQLPPAYRAEIEILLNRALGEIPTKAILQSELNELYTAIQARDQERLQSVLNHLEEILNLNEEQMNEMRQIKELIVEANQEKKAEERAGGGGAESEVEVVPPYTGNLKKTSEINLDAPITADWQFWSHNARKDYLIHKIDNGEFTGYSKTQVRNTRASDSGSGKETDINQMANEFRRQQSQKQGGKGLLGKGLKTISLPKKRIRNLEKSNKIEGVIEKPKPYVPFGRLFIHKHKLKENIVMLHRKSGGNLKELPTHRVSNNLASILNSITGGIIPHIDHIQGLGVRDQENLHRILHYAQIDNVPVPTPKTDDKKEMDRFDILKGEISAGNDNKTLVKEFKVLLLRFIQQGRIPRREGQEILTDLTAMGF